MSSTANPAALANAAKAYEQLKAAFFAPKPDLAQCAAHLTQAKLALAQLGTFLVADPSKPSAQQEMVLARDTLELAALLSIRQGDIVAFERHYAQLATYYIDYAAVLAESPRHLMLRGLHLLSLLAQNRIAEFHAALELIPPQHHLGNVYIRHAVHLEQALMEGAYNKVWHARGDVPAEEALFFIDMLVGTIRDEIASCAERSYPSLPLKDVATLLFFPAGASQASDVLAFCKARTWDVNAADGSVRFAGNEQTESALDAHMVMHNVLGYARELERIV
ncbi:regulatory particle non-ATPase [Blastocladiella emersonii ATCC 22665]|nr:regulatory particle non-ATPase [Blastocladiella emersonii ATCC 22665]